MRLACPACGQVAPGRARFCAACGFGLERAQELGVARRATWAAAIVFIGSLAAIVLSALPALAARGIEPLVSAALLATVGWLATRALGPGALRSSFARGTGALGIASGVAAGGVGFVLGWAFVFLLQRWFGGAPASLELDARAVIGLVVLPALVEEWLCRGVLWLSLRRALGAAETTVCTAALFALLHGLGGGGVFEYPHRFVLGLILGVLRARSGSLVPGILAHGLNNLLALWIGR